VVTDFGSFGSKFCCAALRTPRKFVDECSTSAEEVASSVSPNEPAHFCVDGFLLKGRTLAKMVQLGHGSWVMGEMLDREDQPDEKEALRQYSLKFGECRDGTDSGNLVLFRAMYLI